jgi:hypothetical protein
LSSSSASREDRSSSAGHARGCATIEPAPVRAGRRDRGRQASRRPVAALGFDGRPFLGQLGEGRGDGAAVEPRLLPGRFNSSNPRGVFNLLDRLVAVGDVGVGPRNYRPRVVVSLARRWRTGGGSSLPGRFNEGRVSSQPQHPRCISGGPRRIPPLPRFGLAWPLWNPAGGVERWDAQVG